MSNNDEEPQIMQEIIAEGSKAELYLLPACQAKPAKAVKGNESGKDRNSERVGGEVSDYKKKKVFCRLGYFSSNYIHHIISHSVLWKRN